MKDLSEKDMIAKVGALFTADQRRSGILASVSLAQFILESGWGKFELAQNANNCFGMKCSLSGNTWGNSAWDGSSKYTKETKEQGKDGSYETIIADFRKYPDIEHSIVDHSAYLIGAMNGSKKRYEGLVGETDYKKAVQLIKDGDYASSLTYVDKLCSIIEKWNLTQYDATGFVSGNTGNNMNFPDVPFWVKVKVANLNIRKDATIDSQSVGYTGKGTFTIVEKKIGKVAKDGTVGLWGKLKSGAGWVCLAFESYTEKV